MKTMGTRTRYSINNGKTDWRSASTSAKEALKNQIMRKQNNK